VLPATSPLVVAAVELAAPAPATHAELAANSAAAQAADVADALAALNPEPDPAADARSGKEKKRSRNKPVERARRAPQLVSRNAKAATALSMLPNDCDPPYSIDEHGIKRFHRDCLR
jgi:hypothetical protein